MGFFKVFGRMLQGKPAFEDSETNIPKNQNDISANQKDGFKGKNQHIDQNGRKIIPKLELENVVSHRNGNTMIVTAWMENRSEVEIEVDKIVILGSRQEIDRRLNPGQGHEVTIYKGPVLKNEHDHKVILQYKIVENGDYFAANYSVEFKYESDGMYTIKELKDNNGVKDI